MFVPGGADAYPAYVAGVFMPGGADAYPACAVSVVDAERC